MHVKLQVIEKTQARMMVPKNLNNCFIKDNMVVKEYLREKHLLIVFIM